MVELVFLVIVFVYFFYFLVDLMEEIDLFQGFEIGIEFILLLI